MTTWDSDELTFEDMHLLKMFRIDIQGEENVTTQVFIRGILRDERLLLVTPERQVLWHRLPAGLKGQAYRVHMRSPRPFRMYSLVAHLKPLGTLRGFRTVPVVQAR